MVAQRRIGLLFGAFLLLLCLAMARELWLTTVDGSGLRRRALAQQLQSFPVAAQRGTITDRNGVELAVSEDSITLFADPRLISDPAAVAARLAPLIDQPYASLLAALSDRQRGFVYLARKIPIATGAGLTRLKIAGVGTTVEPRRVYPQGTLAAQMIGAVGTDNYGLSGIEQSLEHRLHGRDGRRRVVSDALGQPISIVDERRAVPGQNVKLTIDAAIEQRVEAVLAGVGAEYSAKGATALVVDPRTGAILADANWPPVDPSDPGAASGYDEQDRAVQMSYEPGSTFKPVAVAGALSDGLITPQTSFVLPPSITLGGATIHDAEPRATEQMTVAQILARSSNVGAITIGLRLGPHRFNRWVRRFGFGASTDIDLPGEAAGIVPSPSQYSGSSMGNLPIGQGVAATPMQMVAAYEALADGGLVHRLHAVAGDPAPVHRVISARVANEVATMLEGVLSPDGTAPEASVPGYTLAGKTGTANKPDPATGGYSDTRYVSSFIGFAPARSARLLVAVIVDEPQGDIFGGSVAGPAFEKIASFALTYLHIPPE